jgi:hypothetical protein
MATAAPGNPLLGMAHRRADRHRVPPRRCHRCSPSNPSCDESTFPFFDNPFKEKVKADATRVLKESDQPTLKVPLGLCNHSAS